MRFADGFTRFGNFYAQFAGDFACFGNSNARFTDEFARFAQQQLCFYFTRFAHILTTYIIYEERCVFMKKIYLVTLLFFLYGCTQQATHPAILPTDDFLVIAHRGASAYAPDHTLISYDMAVRMGADYIELDLQMTKDGKLVALHDAVVSFQDVEQTVADITFDELQLYSPGDVFNEENPRYASTSYENLRVVALEDIFLHFGDTVNYYIELKSPAAYPGMEKALLQQLHKFKLLGQKTTIPKVIIQSFDAHSLKKLFDEEPSIPLIQLYNFENEANISKKDLHKLTKYASGVGINGEAVTQQFVDTMQSKGLHVHPFTINDEETIRKLMTFGVNGLFTDTPDLAIQLKDEKSSMDAK
ncbi:glycerophosphodiester phosphodiesterase family protein [Sporosarcina sp. FSL K6-1522]|uniref:glycerophosphodiester phosphodiesterase family protein n=1 Tax=Sporosarcina sp. FSL K6-1522 TaxID=2921554 RepID=UPI00315A0C9A